MTNTKRVFTLFLLGIFFNAFAQPGSFDASFSGKGLAKFSFKQNTASEMTHASVTDAQGNLYVLGTAASVAFVAKVQANGQLDPAFGNGGKATLEGIVGDFLFFAKAIALHTDGGIVLAGYRNTGESYTIPVIVKLTSTGAPDPGFNGNAVVEAPAHAGFYASFTAVHVLPATGYIIATGGTDGSYGQFLLKKVDQFGNPVDFDSSGKGDGGEITVSNEEQGPSSCSAIFGNTVYMGGTSYNGSALFTAVIINTGGFDTHFDDGTVLIGKSGSEGFVTSNTITSIAVTPANVVVLGGSVSYETGKKTFLMYRLGGGGAVWTTYKEYTSGAANECHVTSLTLDGDKVLLAGAVAPDNESDYQRIVLKIDSEGNLDDKNFLGGGIQTYPGIANQYGITGVSRLSNGTFLLVSSVADDVNVKKIAANGAPLNMGSASELIFGVGNATSYIHDISIRKDGQIFVCGYYYDPITFTNIPVLASLKSNGTLDPSFGGKDGADPGVVNLNKVAPTQLLNSLEATAIQIQDDNKILLAGRFLSPAALMDVFLIRLSSTGTLESTFNEGNGYANFGLADGYAHDIAIQKDNKILVYGYAYNGETNGVAMARFSSTGILDGSFASGALTPGIYTHPNTNTNEQDMRKIEIRIQPADQKIVAVATRIVDDEKDFMAFRLDDKGMLDPDFGPQHNGEFSYNFSSNDDDVVMALCLKPDGKMVMGGFVQHNDPQKANYGLIQLTTAGELDVTFNGNGTREITSEYFNHNIIALEAETNNAIVAMGIAQKVFEGPLWMTALRFTSTGILDNTFKDRGHTTIGRGYGLNAALYNGSFYLAGANDFPEEYPLSAQLVKLKLGTGPVIKATTLQLGDVQKTFNDPDFTLKPISNSPAPVQYSISHGSCATVNPASGLVKINCVPLNTDQYIEIKAYQPAVSGFTEDEVFIRISVAPAIPKITFVKQGGLVDDIILLKASSDSKGGADFEVISDPDNVLESLGGGNVYIQKEGCAQVMVTVSATQNYLQGTALASVCGYPVLIAPEAADDEISLHYLQGPQVINVLANDEGNTGTIVSSSVDLDPVKEGIQTSYTVSALGTFTVDNDGLVTYTPIVELVGTGEISYTIFDSQNMTSEPAKIRLTQTLPPSAPLKDLRATELFTPNGDGLNDAFVIGNRESDKPGNLTVFDRNGQELFTKNDYNNDWKGELPNGKLAETGIYYYVFREDNGRELKGVVELRR